MNEQEMLDLMEKVERERIKAAKIIKIENARAEKLKLQSEAREQDNKRKRREETIRAQGDLLPKIKQEMEIWLKKPNEKDCIKVEYKTGNEGIFVEFECLSKWAEIQANGMILPLAGMVRMQVEVTIEHYSHWERYHEGGGDITRHEVDDGYKFTVNLELVLED